MKVSDLITRLRELPENATVVVAEGLNDGYIPIREVETCTLKRMEGERETYDFLEDGAARRPGIVLGVRID